MCSGSVFLERKKCLFKPLTIGMIIVRRRTLITLGAAGVGAIVGGDLLFAPQEAQAASKLALPVGTNVFNTIRPQDVLNRPVKFVFGGKKVRRLLITSPTAGVGATFQNRNSYEFRATWKQVGPVKVFLTANIGTFARAKEEAWRHVMALSRIPYRFRKQIEEIVIQPGKGRARGGNGNIYTFADSFSNFSNFQATIFHEVGHTVQNSMAPAMEKGWKQAIIADQKAAPRFNGAISQYNRDHPWREALSSAIVPWYSMRKYPGRLTPQQRTFLREQMPNRLRFLNNKFPVK